MQLFSFIESPFPLALLDNLCDSLGIQTQHFSSSRKLIKALKQTPPDFIFAEFLYGYSNNYAGVNISNLDVMLYAMQTSAKQTKVITVSQKEQQVHVAKLDAIFPIYGNLNWQTLKAGLPMLLKQAKDS
ncbi:MAG TPA: hypothetical protein ENK73_01730 [Thiomicrospira sp.]|nr:hypothetical protein [Thiomicrospira sp.]